MKKVLIEGITGQDSSYLTEFSINKSYKCYRLARCSSVMNRQKIENF